LVTFDPHPLEVVNPGAAPLLLTVGPEKSEVLAESELDYVVVLPFTPGLAAYSATQFVDEILIRRLRMREFLIGHDHGFGRNRGGNVEMLRAMAPSRGFGVEVIPPVGNDHGHAFSSTAIRRAVAGGDLSRAAEALGRPYAVSGCVVAGSGRGRDLGFRTINLSAPPVRKLLPPDGVYAVRVQTPQGPFNGMMNLGGRPTFDEADRQLEAHLFDAAVDLYGAHVRLDFIARLREVRRFDSPAALIAQLGSDEAAARRALAETP
jgi:riboflavin kinase/FMN adenylyltransferase